jgi:hypothetical protein
MKHKRAAGQVKAGETTTLGTWGREYAFGRISLSPMSGSEDRNQFLGILCRRAVGKGQQIQYSILVNIHQFTISLTVPISERKGVGDLILEKGRPENHFLWAGEEATPGTNCEIVHRKRWGKGRRMRKRSMPTESLNVRRCLNAK